MEQALDRIVSLPGGAGLAEERMLRGDLVREIVARKQRGEGIKRIARELGGIARRSSAGCGSAVGSRGKAAVHLDQSHSSPNSSSGGGRRWAGTGRCCTARWPVWALLAVISRCSAFLSPTEPSGGGRSWRRCGSRPLGTIRNLVFEQWLNERSSCVKQLLIAL